MIFSILMAGGRGTRLNNKVEKPLYNFNGKPLIDHVIENLQKSKVDKIIIALSPHTNQTLKHLKEKGFKNFNLNLLDSYNEFILNTPGEGYLKDYNYILELLEKHSKKDTVLFINTDLPFINYNILNKVLNEYLKIQTDALSVFVPEEIFNTNNLDYKYAYKGLVPSGLNIVRSENIIQEQEDLILPHIELALNMNTLNNIQIGLKLLK